ncbi:MAG TPA: 3-isopropylmalate dehydrogenase, partial [Acidobacteriota bacterium]|nr:3-isopropylmalate dehydrogenase [Acidobacteriota bacterium]
MTKSAMEERLQAILSSPSYRLVEEDAEFLSRDELRPVRMQLELLKPEIFFREKNINSTVVVFGGTQIVESGRARKRLERAEE